MSEIRAGTMSVCEEGRQSRSGNVAHRGRSGGFRTGRFYLDYRASSAHFCGLLRARNSRDDLSPTGPISSAKSRVQ